MMPSTLRKAIGILLAGGFFALLAGCSQPVKKIEPDDAKRQWREINEAGKKERGIE